MEEIVVKKYEKHSYEQITTLIFYLMLIGVPFIVTTVQSLICKQNLFVGVPHNSDEICYWRVLYSVSECGFDFGSTCGYLNCEAAVGPLGEHGLGTLFAWGGILLFGTVTENALFLWNMLFLAIALAVFCFALKPDINIVIWVMLFLVGNGVLLEQWYSHMMEIPCLAILIICITIQLLYERVHKTWLCVLGCACITYASCMRICYIILLFPMITEVWSVWRNEKKKIWNQILSMLIYIAYFMIVRKTCKLFIKSSNSFLTDMNSENVFDRIILLTNNFKNNFWNYFSFNAGTHIEVGQRYFQLCLLVVLLVAAFIRLDNHKLKFVLQKKYLSQAIALAGLITMIMLLYDVSAWRDVRTTMPYAIGVSIWLIVNIAGEKLLERVFFFCCVITLFVFAPAKYCENHPRDRYEKIEADVDWVEDIPNEKSIICLYNSSLNFADQFLLYKKLPPKVGILIGRTFEEVADAPNIDFILTSEKLNVANYELWRESTDYGFCYRKVD